MGFFVLCLLAWSCSVLVLHGKWRKQRKEQSHAPCHVTQRNRIFDKVSEHVYVAKSLYQRFPLHHSPGFMHDVPVMRRSWKHLHIIITIHWEFKLMMLQGYKGTVNFRLLGNLEVLLLAVHRTCIVHKLFKQS